MKTNLPVLSFRAPGESLIDFWNTKQDRADLSLSPMICIVMKYCELKMVRKRFAPTRRIA